MVSKEERDGMKIEAQSWATEATFFSQTVMRGHIAPLGEIPMDKSISTSKASHKLLKVVQVIRQDVDPRLEAKTLDLLLRIGLQPGTSQVVLSERVGVTISAISRSVQKLVKLGLVVRYEEEGDRRNKVTKLTTKGERVLERIAKALEDKS